MMSILRMVQLLPTSTGMFRASLEPTTRTEHTYDFLPTKRTGLNFRAQSNFYSEKVTNLKQVNGKAMNPI